VSLVRLEDANATLVAHARLDLLDPLVKLGLLVKWAHVAKTVNMAHKAVEANRTNRDPSTAADAHLVALDLQDLPVPPDLLVQTARLEEPVPQENQLQLDRQDPKDLPEIKDQQDRPVQLDQMVKMARLVPRARPARRDNEDPQEPQDQQDNLVSQALQVHKDHPVLRVRLVKLDRLGNLVRKAHQADQVEMETTPNTARAPHTDERPKHKLQVSWSLPHSL